MFLRILLRAYDLIGLFQYGQPQTVHADLLTRTTLEMDASTPAPSVAILVAMLKRVPGVLLAEANPATARAIVAHDAGVAVASLLAAAGRAGVCARVVTAAGVPVIDRDMLSAPNHAWMRRLLVALMASFLSLALIDTLMPKEKAWFASIALASLGIFLLVKALARPR